MLKVLYDPTPRTTDEIFSDEDKDRFLSSYRVVEVDERNRKSDYRQHIIDADVVISQQALDRELLEEAGRLKAVFNVETNFLPNIDYDYCFGRGIHVLTPASVFAVPVAEMGLGMALSLARDIHTAHNDFIEGNEAYGLAGNSQAELLTGSRIGIVGFGDLGRAIKRLLAPFNARTEVHDPWLPDSYLKRQGVQASSLEDLLKNSRLVFVTAAVTSENQQIFNRESLALMPDGAMLILLSRAALADFDALASEAATGRLRFATDVFPQEPLPADSPLRQVPNILFSAHRAGALSGALQQIGSLVLEDLEQISNGLPPVVCRRAERETVSRLQSKPIERT